MGILGNIKNFFAATKPVAQRQFNTLLGGVANWHTYVSNSEFYQSASSQIAIACAVRIISSSIASMPLNIYKLKADGSKVIDKKHYLHRILYKQPNPNMTSMEWRELMLQDLLYGGNHYCYLDYGLTESGKYELLQIIPLISSAVYIRYVEDFKVEYYVNGALVPRDKILHIKFNSKNGLMGSSIIEQHRTSVDTMAQTEQYANAFYRNGARLTGILETDNVLHDETVFERMRTSFNELYGGVDNAYKVAVLEGGLKYKPISVSPRDAQYIEQKKFNIADISRMFNVPLHMLAELDRATFSNIEHQNLEFLTHSLVPHMTRIEQSLMTQLIPLSQQDTHIIEHDMSALTRGDIETRYKVYQMARQNGLMSANEIRAKEQLPPVEYGDEMFINGAVMPVSVMVNQKQQSNVTEGGNQNGQQGNSNSQGSTNV